MDDCLIRVSENNYSYISSSYTTNRFVCFDVLNGDMAAYLGKEILTITNYIHAISGGWCNTSTIDCGLDYGLKTNILECLILH